MRYRLISLIGFLFSLICVMLILEMSADMVGTIRAEPPGVINITFSATEMRAGTDPIYVQVNAEDAEDPESNLTIEDIEWQYNGLNGGEISGTWSDTWFGTSTYYASGGFLRIPFQPPSGAAEGFYGFRVKVKDTDGNKSDPYMERFEAVFLVPLEPDIEYVKPETYEVFRGEQLTVRMKGDDAVDSQYQLTSYLEYKKKGTSTWTEISDSRSYNNGGDYWELYWEPDISLETGAYEFQGRFNNSDGFFSDYYHGDLDVTVKNNIPTAINIGIVGSATSVDRMDTMTLGANGDDEETAENHLTTFFEYSAPGDTWDNTFFSNMDYDEENNRWIIDFEPESDAELGDYSFRVYFRDSDNANSDLLEMSSTITVNNVKPVVQDLTVPFSALRGETITLIANGWDADGSEGALIPTFEYRPPIGSWTPVPGSANYIGTSWRMPWAPGANEEVGQYGFRVRFSDDDDESNWFENRNTFTLENNQPWVEIDHPDRDGAVVMFNAFAFDMEDPDFDMGYDWDFGDGFTSPEPFPTHEYRQSGTYDVTVTVTDSDGDTATDTVTIVIPADEFPSSGLPEPIRFIFLIIFIIAVIITAFIALLIFKRQGEKRKGEGV